MPDVVLKIQFEQIESNSGIHSFPPSRGVTSLVARCFETGFENTWKEEKNAVPRFAEGKE